MKQVARKTKDAMFFVFSPQAWVLILLGVLYWGGQAALVGYVAFKAYALITSALA